MEVIFLLLNIKIILLESWFKVKLELNSSGGRGEDMEEGGQRGRMGIQKCKHLEQTETKVEQEEDDGQRGRESP